jgi:hypothetical protein
MNYKVGIPFPSLIGKYNLSFLQWENYKAQLMNKATEVISASAPQQGLEEGVLSRVVEGALTKEDFLILEKVVKQKLVRLFVSSTFAGIFLFLFLFLFLFSLSVLTFLLPTII